MREPLYVSESTVAQRETEVECEPYFANLTDLPPDQIDHLRQTGLLPSSGLAIQLLRDKHVEYLSQVWKRSLGGKKAQCSAYWCVCGRRLVLLENLTSRVFCFVQLLLLVWMLVDLGSCTGVCTGVTFWKKCLRTTTDVGWC